MRKYKAFQWRDFKENVITQKKKLYCATGLEGNSVCEREIDRYKLSWRK